MTVIKLENEQSSLFVDIQKNDEEYSISDMIKMLRYVSDCLEKGNVIHDSKFLYMKAFKKEKQK